jgi:hypothetical protein
MPTVRKLTSDEVRSIENRGKGLRKLIEEEYDSFLGDYAVGDYGEADLSDDEKRLTVRNRLKAAARRRGLSVDFKRTQGSILRFRISPETVAAPASASKAKGKGRGKKKGS